MVLNREQILNKSGAFRTKQVNVPEWDGDVIIKELSGRDFVEMQKESSEDNMKPDYYGKIIQMSVVDEAGKKMFSKADVEALSELGGTILTNLVKEIVEFNRMKDVDGAVEETIKN